MSLAIDIHQFLVNEIQQVVGVAQNAIKDGSNSACRGHVLGHFQFL